MPGSEPHRLGLPTATGELARLAAREVRAAGIDLEPLLQASRLSSAQIEDSDERLGAEEQITFVEAAAHTLGRNRLGFELALEFDLRRIGLLYYVITSRQPRRPWARPFTASSGTAQSGMRRSCSGPATPLS
jgi:hypothetical protein